VGVALRDASDTKEDLMDNGTILICYDGSDAARRAFQAAPAVLGARRAVILDVAPALTAAESYAVMASAVGGAEFEDLNMSEALARANEGADLARAAGFTAEPRGALGAPTWEGTSTSQTRSTQP